MVWYSWHRIISYIGRRWIETYQQILFETKFHSSEKSNFVTIFELLYLIEIWGVEAFFQIYVKRCSSNKKLSNHYGIKNIRDGSSEMANPFLHSTELTWYEPFLMILKIFLTFFNSTVKYCHCEISTSAQEEKLLI